jgi:DNA-binding YbaB/EbfC family protein
MTDAPGPSGFPDLGGLLEQAQQMQQQLMAAQAEAANTVVEGSAGGGAVKVEVTGGLEFRTVQIDPSVVDPEDPSLLEDLVLAALHDAMSQIQEMQEGAMGGLDLGGLGGLGGGQQGELGGLFGGND